MGFAGAFRRSELLALEVADLLEVPDGLRVTIRHSKTDPEGEGQAIALPRGTRLRPVETLQTRLAAAAITEGPVFRPMLKGGRVQPSPLGDEVLVREIKRRAAAAGLDPAAFAGHSLSCRLPDRRRRGRRRCAEDGHRSMDTLRGYVRRANLFRAHAGATFL